MATKPNANFKETDLHIPLHIHRPKTPLRDVCGVVVLYTENRRMVFFASKTVLDVAGLAAGEDLLALVFVAVI